MSRSADAPRRLSGSPCPSTGLAICSRALTGAWGAWGEWSGEHEAERKMGQMLAQTERAVGADKAGRSKKLDGNRALPSNPPPTLDKLGVSKRERQGRY